MDRIEPAIVIALAAHGEHGAVGRFLSADQGLVAAYVRGGRGRRLRGVLALGNQVALDITARAPGQLAFASVYPLSTNMAMMHGAAALALVDYVALLAASTLPEGEAQPGLYPLFAALFAAAGAGADALASGAALVRLELALLAGLGLGLDLSSCAATGSTEDLAFVSPKSRQAVSRAAGEPWAARLLPLPLFLRDGGVATPDQLADGLKLSGHFLSRELLASHPAQVRLQAARQRLAGLLIG
ncbi:DNA repair protein RecO [Sandarakinorhabdus sp.]|uniref:DNA repair protein RecO n=1 Tax=Sandarakinorhabdus sp. TaxID=1916663 RepID=UPI003F6F0AD1